MNQSEPSLGYPLEDYARDLRTRDVAARAILKVLDVPPRQKPRARESMYQRGLREGYNEALTTMRQAVSDSVKSMMGEGK